MAFSQSDDLRVEGLRRLDRAGQDPQAPDRRPDRRPDRGPDLRPGLRFRTWMRRLAKRTDAAGGPVAGVVRRAAGAARAVLGALGRRRRWVAAAAAALVGALALAALSSMASEVEREAMGAALSDISAWRIAGALAATGLSFLALTFYDWTAFAALGDPRPWARVAPGSAAAFAVSQTVGLGPVTGAAVRLRVYAPLGVSACEVIRVVAFATVSFGLGLLAVASAAALIDLQGAAAFAGVSRLQVILASLAGLGLTVALIAAGGRRPALPARALLLRQLLVTVADVAAAATVLWLLLPAGAISWPAFLPLYALALGLGTLSHAPAGIGVFEIVILAGLSGAAPAEALAAALLLYRLIYHALPLAVALAGLGLWEARRAMASGPLAAGLRFARGYAPQAAAGLCLAAGAAAVLSALAQSLGTAPRLEPIAASMAGGALIAASQGLSQRLQGAWRLAVLGGVTATAALAGTAPSVSAACGALSALLILSQGGFARPSRLALPAVSRRGARLAAAVVVPVVLALVWRRSGASAATLADLPSPDLEGLAGLAALCAALAAGGLGLALRPAAPSEIVSDPQTLARVRAIVDAQGVADARLAESGDKRFVFSRCGRGFVMYGRAKGCWLALHDPVGPKEIWPDLIWTFLETARQAGARPAFYQVSPEHLSLYAEAGLRFMKLGEQARMNLAEFSMSGRKRAAHRTALSKGEREGLSVEILCDARIRAEYPRLREITESWLAGRAVREKGFSLGGFSLPWLLAQRVAVLREHGRIVAFAGLMTTPLGEEVSVDMMRAAPEAPPAAMEFLFLRLFAILQAEGVRWFDMGAAPFSGMSESEAAPAWQKFGRELFEEGARAYSFKGLRTFKERLRPEWRTRYMALGPGASPARALLAANRLVNRPEGGRREETAEGATTALPHQTPAQTPLAA